MTLPAVVSREEWRKARIALLAKEKDLTKARDELNARRRDLPMVEIEKNYTFEGTDGTLSLLDMFEGRRQLILYHFMMTPGDDWRCAGCSLLADGINHLEHLYARNTSLVVVSRAPLPEIESFKKRMGWTFPWYSSYGSDFNYDFHVTLDDSVAPPEYNYRTPEELKAAGQSHFTHGDQPGTSVFLRDGARVFHTYSTFNRGSESLLTTYNYLDLTPLGRQENWEEPPGRADTHSQGWLRLHDEY
ncbi:DUF899 domain-containing protein [Amycolatopsis sp. NPDC024027]|uniref:DUF899 domain-containing protein n=1 Tax=Amycolatopsis sp. NPDC024027 TaxID=3154327 RepID=UPI0034073E31